MKIKKFLQPFAGINIDDNYSNRNVVRNNDGSYSVNYNNSNYTIYPSALDSNNITITTPDVVVKGKRPYSSWRWGTYVPFEYSRNSYYRPEDAMEAFNVFTGGGLNNFSPTQWYRRIKDLSKLHNGLLSKEDYWNKWLNGNEGLVSQDFQKEHPYWSMAINGVGDAATLGIIGNAGNINNGIKNLYNLYRLSKDLNKSIQGIKPEIKNEQSFGLMFQSTKPKDVSTSLKFFERPSKISELESLGFGKSRGFNSLFGEDLHSFYTLQDRRLMIQDSLKKLKASSDLGVDETIAKNSGAQLEDGMLMSNGYKYNFANEKGFSTGMNMSFGRQGAGGIGHNYGLNLGGMSSQIKHLPENSEIVYSRPGANLNRDSRNLEVVITKSDNEANKRGVQLLTKAMKDMESGAEFSGDASSTTGSEALSSWLRLAKNKPILRQEAMNNARRVLKTNEGIDLGKHSIYDPIHGINTENATMSPDAYSYLYRTASNNPDKFHLGYLMNAGNFNSFARNPKNAYMYNVEQNYLDGLITPQEYIKQYNSWVTPLGGRKAYIYNGQVYKPQPFLIRNKQGGTIHIKKKNRGKFTDYCNGKVTNECIQKGKNSPNPVIRKRATFAANVRKWKHESGGKFNGFVKGVNVLDSDKDAYKYVKKKYKMRSALNSDNTNNWIQKAGKWLNSDQGKAFSGLATDLISYGVNLKNINKAYKQLKEALQKLYDYIASNIDDSQLKNQALENLINLPEGQHVGMVDLLTEQEKLRREALKKQKTLADNWLANQELNLNNWMQSVQGGASDNLQSSITNFINTYGNKDKV